MCDIELSLEVLEKFQDDLLNNARNNWCKSQVDMLEALIISTSKGIDYADAFEQLKVGGDND